MLADVDAPSLASAVQSLKNIGPDVRGVACDVADPGSVDHAAKTAFEAFGNVHILCNNAGVISGGGIDGISLEEWRWVIDVKVMGVLHGIRTFLPHIRSYGEGGHIVNTASMAGMRNGLGLSPYSATKFAVVSMSEGLAAELKPFGIGVSVLCPGFVRTRIMESQRNRPTSYSSGVDPQRRNLRQRHRLVNAGIDPADIASRAVAAIQNDELYVIIHPPASGTDLQARFSAILAAFDRTLTEPAVVPR